ncbi:hypothetical protein G6011_00086 [Alternaria panax]|uniref:Uncharacterized protein n=1 Tax=Alternaria panax TaxID=48097 RepID=A0AAD4IHI7_9PLEO|nr:hypothetical protein G6011_00086 [Alternaria panax]
MHTATPLQTAPGKSNLFQGVVSIRFTTVTKTAYATSMITVPTAAKYTATKLGAIVPPSLLKNATAAYNVVDKSNDAAKTYAIKYALAAALTAGATLAWHIRRTALPPAPPGIDRSKWLALKHCVHVWLHKKLRSDDGLRRELEHARRQLEKYEILKRVDADHAGQTDLSGEAQPVQDGGLQPTMDFNSMPDEATSLRQELEVEKDNTTRLQQELTVAKGNATVLQQALQNTMEELGRSNIARKREAQERAAESEIHRRESDDAEAAIAWLQKQLKAAQKEAKQTKTRPASREEKFRVAQAADQEAFHLKTQLDFSKEELDLAQTEIETFNHEAKSMSIKLQVAEQEAKEVKNEVTSMEKKLNTVNGDTKIAENSLGTVRKLLPDVQAQIDTLTTQLEASRKEEEKRRNDVSSLERELGETRLEHSKQVASLKLLPALNNNENEDLKKELQQEIVRRKELETEVKKLQSELLYLRSYTEFYQGRLETYTTDLEALETKVEKLQAELNTAKARNVAKPPRKSFTSSGTHTLLTTDSFEGSTPFQNGQTLHTPPQLLSVAGCIIPSTPRPSDLPATPTTPATTSTSKPEKTPDSVAIAYLYRDGKINLLEYVEGLAALPPRSNKRKPNDTEETTRPAKKSWPAEDSTSHTLASVLTPSGEPAFTLFPRVASVEDADDDAVSDGSQILQPLEAAEKTKSSTNTTGLDNATP